MGWPWSVAVQPSSLEASARRSERVQITRPGRGVFAGLLAELCDIVGESSKVRIDDRVGPEGRQNPRLPIRLANRLVIVERIEGRIGGREDFED